MTTPIYSFEAYKRPKTSKHYLTHLRKDQKIPGVIYNKDYNQAIYIHNAHGEHMLKVLTKEKNLFSCTISNETFLVIIKDIKKHPIKLYITHIDLQKVELSSIIKTRVPFFFIDEKKSPGILAGGYIIKHMESLIVKTTVENMPNHINIDLKYLTSNKSLFLKDIKFPNNINIPILSKKENLNLLIVRAGGAKTPIENKKE
ncbi:MAG TPA: 50S ribosomal protein L25 [Candidatus Azoamicus sp. OHIO2]